MGMELSLNDILKDVRAASANIDSHSTATAQRIAAVEKGLDELYLKANRPGGFGGGDRESDVERKDAAELCRVKHYLDKPKNDGIGGEYVPSSSEVDEALLANKAMRSLFRHGNLDRLDNVQRKSLSSFAFGSNQYILAPQWSDRVLSCLADPTDVSGLMGQATTSVGSLKFFIDNQRMRVGAWACEASCFSNNPQPDLQDGLGELEIKTETLRFIVCASRDLLEDAAINVESWLVGKVSSGMRATINNTLITGDGIGKPM